LMDVISNIHDSPAFQFNKIIDRVRKLLNSVIHSSIYLFYKFRSECFRSHAGNLNLPFRYSF
jgi:hypothetical protein